MPKLFQTIFDIESGSQILTDRPYGMIEAIEGRLHAVHIRPLPKLISVAEANWLGGWNHKRVRRDRVQLYYNQPLGHRNYLALKYIVSTLGTTLATLRIAMRTLDEIARLKKTDAIVCEVTNRRLTDRIMQFAGFERHLPNSRKCHYIRRFYGHYPATSILKQSDICELEKVQAN